MSDPWLKFYPSDWRAEPSLRAVSLAARGIWIEMLCLMHEAEPRGHLLLNGRPVTDSQLAALAGVPLNTAQECLGELESAGTFSRTRAGVIYSRRMRADTATSKKQRANVEKRWSKERVSANAQDVETQGEKRGRITKSIPTPIPKKPEARSQKETPIPPDLVEAVWREVTPEGRCRGSKTELTDALRRVRETFDDAAIVAGVRAYYAQCTATGTGHMGVHRLLWQSTPKPGRPGRIETFVEAARPDPLDLAKLRALVRTAEASPGYPWPVDRLGLTLEEARQRIGAAA